MALHCIIPHGITPWLWWWMDGWSDGYQYTFILILCFIFHCMLFKELAVFIFFWWLVSISNCSLYLACKTLFHKLYCVEAIGIMRSFYVFYGCIFLMHILQPKTFLYTYLKNVLMFPSNLISTLGMKSKATVPQNVKAGLLKQCISSIPCKFKSVEKIILYKINFILVKPTWHTILFSCMFISILYMIWATSCSSSGESIVSIQLLVYVTLCNWLTCIPDSHLHRVTYTRSCIDTIYSPADEHEVAWNM
jgi:hypothetical protein